MTFIANYHKANQKIRTSMKKTKKKYRFLFRDEATEEKKIHCRTYTIIVANVNCVLWKESNTSCEWYTQHKQQADANSVNWQKCELSLVLSGVEPV